MTSRRASIWLAVLVITAACFAVYANSINCPFVFDDHYTIVKNPFIRTLWPISSAISSPYQSSVAGRPVVAFSLALSHAVNGLDQRVFHLTNILVHLAAGLLLFGVIRRTLLLPIMKDQWGESATFIAGATSVLWIVHPLQTESVTYIVQRAESIVSMFYLATFYCFIRFVQSARPLHWAWAILAVICCALGMGSKEIMITAPFVIIVYDRMFIAETWRELRQRWAIHASLACTWIILYLIIRTGPRSDSAGFSMPDLGPLTYAATQFGVILHYLRLTVFPATLNIDYAWQYVVAPAEWVPHMLFVLLLLAATVLLLIRAPRAGFLAAAFFIILSPTSSFVPISDAAFEHRMYLALAPLCCLAVIGPYQLMKRLIARRPESGHSVQFAFRILLLAACAALAVRTIVRNRDYSTALRLWESVIEANPNNPRAYVSMGNHLMETQNWTRAEEMYTRARHIDPHYPASYYGLATSLLQQGKADAALKMAQEASRMDTVYPEAKLLIGKILTSLNRLDEAEVAFKECLAINPDHAEANFSLACIYDKHDQNAEAEKHYLRAINVQPSYAEAAGQLADLYMRMGQPQDAVDWYLKHLELVSPTPRELNRLATSLAQINKLDEAIRYYQEALKLDPNQPPIRLNFGNTLMRIGRKDEAIAQYEEALKIKPDFLQAQQALDRARRAPKP